MRPVLALSLFGLSMLCPGCALTQDAFRNLKVAVCTPIEAHQELARNRLWAETAWAKASPNCGTRGDSEDYAQGFKDGYAEYLYRGGDGEPPLLAPKRYRHVQYQTPQGYLAVEEWFAGYRHGSAVARDTGARRWITGPTGWQPEPQGAVAHRPSKPNQQPDTLPMPEVLPKATLEQRLPEGVTIEVEPPPIPSVLVEDVPPVDSLRAKITGVNAAAAEMPDPPQPKATIKGIIVPPVEQPAPKATIRGIIVQPPTTPEAVMEPVRVRIRTVTPATPKD
jgi:hypothetical protein